jgi:hypothetical protein
LLAVCRCDGGRRSEKGDGGSVCRVGSGCALPGVCSVCSVRSIVYLGGGHDGVQRSIHSQKSDVRIDLWHEGCSSVCACVFCMCVLFTVCGGGGGGGVCVNLNVCVVLPTSKDATLFLSVLCLAFFSSRTLTSSLRTGTRPSATAQNKTEKKNQQRPEELAVFPVDELLTLRCCRACLGCLSVDAEGEPRQARQGKARRPLRTVACVWNLVVPLRSFFFFLFLFQRRSIFF